MKNKTIQRIKKSRLGRLLCRIVGEDTGAIMMEYVLVAMRIAAATVAAATYFGRSAQGMFGALSRAIWGDEVAAIERINDGRDEADKNADEGEKRGAAYSTTPSAAGNAGTGM